MAPPLAKWRPVRSPLVHRTRRARVVLVVLALVVVAAIGGGIVAITSGPHLTPAQIEAQRLHQRLVAEQGSADRAKRLVAAHLPTVSAAAAPVATAPLFTAPLKAHHVVG
jgi:hypothetical protein